MSSPAKESTKSAAVKGKEDKKEATKKSTLGKCLHYVLSGAVLHGMCHACTIHGPQLY